jgi:hypothetical protein
MRNRSLVLLMALAAGACVTSASSVRSVPEGPWIEPSIEFQRQIEQHAARLAYLQKLDDFVGEIQWFVGAGEPAYSTLLKLAGSEDTKVAGTALAAIGGSQDARLVPFLEAIPWPPPEATRLRYERARCHMKLGDWSHVDDLIDGLRDEELYARSLCFRALWDATGETFDYHPKAEVQVREASLARWEDWSVRITGDAIQDR